MPVSSPATPSEASAPDGRSGWLERLLLAAGLGVVLVLTPVLGLFTSYAVLLVALLFALHNLARGRRGRWNLAAPGWTFLAAFAAIALLFALTARQPGDAVFTLNFLAFIFFVPLATLFDRNAAAQNATLVAWLALAGAGVACAASLLEVFGLGYSRAGTIFSDHIRLANTAVILGFISLIGLLQRAGWSRWIFLLGPAFAFVVVLLTGARIAMLAFPVLAFGALLLLFRHKAQAVAVGALAVAALGIAAYAGWFGSSRVASLFSIAGAILEGEPVGDKAVRIRLELYKAGWIAFQESPFIGHGWAQLMSAPARHLPEAYQHRASLPHLHNEVLNFAVFGGLAGVFVYLALLVAPLLAAWRSVRDSQYAARLAGTALLVLSYVVMGLTDTMLSFELHTSLYVGWTAVLLGFCRDRPLFAGAAA